LQKQCKGKRPEKAKVLFCCENILLAKKLFSKTVANVMIFVAIQVPNRMIFYRKSRNFIKNIAFLTIYLSFTKNDAFLRVQSYYLRRSCLGLIAK
jgi:hypothetical protein